MGDLWLSDTHENIYPYLFSYAKKQNCSFKFFLEQPINSNFSFPMSPQALEQLSELENLLENLQRDDQINDRWEYIWGPSQFSPSKANKALRGVQQASPLFRWL
jgi:hypothetical protein